jgi:hypothetical protein
LGTPIEIGPFLIEYDDKPGANEEMTAAKFREMALSFPEAVEAAHMGHRIFGLLAGFSPPLVIRMKGAVSFFFHRKSSRK